MEKKRRDLKTNLCYLAPNKHGESYKKKCPLLEDTQNIVLTEDQILLVVDIDAVSAEARNEDATSNSRIVHSTGLPS